MIFVSSIDLLPKGHQKRVTLYDTEKEETHVLTYGSDTSDTWIRQMAPALVGKANKTKRGNRKDGKTTRNG